MKLTDVQIRSLESRDTPFKLADGNGLFLVVKPSGSRLWRFKFKFDGLEKSLSFGTYPLVTLKSARTSRDEARRLLAAGIDPAAAKQNAKRAAAPIEAEMEAAPTFAEIVDEYLERMRHDGRAETTITKNRYFLETVAGPDLGHRPIASITPAEILSLLQKVERSGRHETARSLRSTMSSVFRLAVVTLRTPTDPTAPLIGATRAPKVVSHPAIIDEKKFGWLLNTIDVYDGWPTLRCAMQFSALTAARPGEVRLAEWSEFDLPQRTWTIPPQRTKTREEHVVPLSEQAMSVVSDARQYTSRSRLVFAAVLNADRPLSENAVNSALRRMGVTHDEHTAHGFRSSFSTILNKRRFDPEVIERALAHKDGSVRGIYNRDKSWDERVALMQSWADLLDEFREL